MFGTDLTKFSIAVFGALLVVSIGFYFYQSHDLNALERDMNYCFLRDLPEVGKVGYEIRLKQGEIEKDLKRGLDIYSYLDERCREAGIDSHNLSKSKPKEDKNIRSGYIDITTEITPGGKGGKRGKMKFHRRDIAKFLFLLEVRTTCLKVTSLTLDRPSDDCEQWSMRLSITERKPLK